MRIDIITVLPQLLESWLSHSIIKRAQDKKCVEIHIHNLRDFGIGKQKQVDDYQFGGGAGMVMMVEPIFECISHLKQQRNYSEIIYTSPDGKTLNQQTANEISLTENMIILCGHYKGVDQRVRDHLITREISIGDYVLSGGELAASVICDSIIRLIPGVLNNETSALTDSFQDGLLAPPVYTRPAVYRQWEVPEILTSGNTKAIEEWRDNQARLSTEEKRPDLLP